MLMAVDPKNLYESYESQFVEGLLHPDTKVRLLCLKMVSLC